MVDQLHNARRRLVPTDRELAVGQQASEFVAAPVEEKVQRAPFFKALRRYLGDLNPASIEGPTYILLIFGIFLLVAEWDAVSIGVLLPEMRTTFGFSLQFLLTIGSVVLVDAQAYGEKTRYVFGAGPDWRRFLLSTAMLGAFASGQRDAARDIWASYSGNLYPDKRFPPHVVFLANWGR